MMVILLNFVVEHLCTIYVNLYAINISMSQAWNIRYVPSVICVRFNLRSDYYLRSHGHFERKLTRRLFAIIILFASLLFAFGLPSICVHTDTLIECARRTIDVSIHINGNSNAVRQFVSRFVMGQLYRGDEFNSKVLFTC